MTARATEIKTRMKDHLIKSLYEACVKLKLFANILQEMCVCIEQWKRIVVDTSDKILERAVFKERKKC
jgi:hypothetical protein